MSVTMYAEKPADDVIVVLTDVEVFGLIGAIEFTGKHPLMKDVRLAL